MIRCPRCNGKIEKKINLYTGKEVEIVKSELGNWFINGDHVLRCTEDFKKNNRNVEFFKLHECGVKNDNSKSNQELPLVGRH